MHNYKKFLAVTAVVAQLIFISTFGLATSYADDTIIDAPVVDAVAADTVDTTSTDVVVAPIEETAAPAEVVVSEPLMAAVITSDKADYHPGETASLFGNFFGALQNIVLSIFGTNEDGTDFTGPTINVVADDAGAFTTNYTLENIFRPFYTVIAQSTATGAELARMTFADSFTASVDAYSQCANGTGTGPTCNWTNGNLNASNSVYTEGDATVQRLAINDLTPGTHTVTIQYDSLKGGKHAYDFITDDKFSENWVTSADLCSSPLTNFASCATTAAVYSSVIPAAPNASSWDTSATTTGRRFAIRNATWTSVGTPTVVSGADQPTNIQLSFTVPANCVNKYQKQGSDVCEVLVTFGAHVSRQIDWGTGNSAVNISGSPYHVRVVDLDGGTVGNRDNQMSATAIVVPTTATLTLVKTITNDNGGAAAATAWTLSATGPTTISGTTGSASVTNAAVNAGTYTLAEANGPSGYTASAWSCVGGALSGSSLTLTAGQTATCTINNNDQPGTLIVKKLVVNDNGGTMQAGVFSFQVNNGAATSFTQVDATHGENTLTENAGTYSVTEPAVSGYATTYSNCSGVVIANGGTATCTITNNDIAPQLTVIKHVINDQDGALSASNFTMNVTGTNVSSASFPGSETGTVVTLNSGTYSVDETDAFGYTKSLSVDCSGSITVGQTKTCTITNNDVDVLPSISVTKTAGVASVDEPGANVTYTFVVTNTSPNALDPVTIVSLSDDKFGTLTGDADCQVGTVIPVGGSCTFNYVGAVAGEGNTSHVNVFTAHAKDNENNDVSATDDATVLINDVKPSVDLVKSVDQTTLPEPGGAFNYTLTITNTSVENVIITDLSDTNAFGAGCLALVNTVLTPGQVVSCTYAVSHADAGTYANTASVTVEDNELNSVTDTDNKTVKVVGATISIDPLAATNNVNDPHTFMVQVQKNDGSGWVAANGEHVDFTLINAGGATAVLNTVSSTCDDAGANTDVLGQCTIVFSSATPGTITVHAKTDVTIGTDNMHRETDGTLGSSADAVKTYIGGKIIVNKVTVGGDGSFTFDTDYSADFQLGNGGSNDSGYISTGTHLVTETEATGWDLTNTSCVSSLGGSEDNTAIVLTDGEIVTCTFTNTKRGSITIVKNTIGGDSTFAFTGNVGVTSLTTVGNTGSQTITNLVPGNTYNIAETEQAGWSQTNAVCDNGTPDAIVVAPGVTTTCTFTNTQKGHLIVSKVTDPANDLTSFVVTASGSGTITGGGAGTISTAAPQNYEVTPGTYSVAETVPSGWSKTGDSCQNVTVAAGQNATCTITNTKLGHIVINKLANGGNATFGFAVNGITTATPSITTTGTPGTGSVTVDVLPGSYTVGETVLPTNWVFVGLDCGAGVVNTPTSAAFNVAAGATVTCNVENTKKGATRTQGFWSTHTGFTNAHWNADVPTVEQTLNTWNAACSASTKVITATTPTGTNMLMGGFWANVANKTTNPTKRSDLDKARMTLLQQLEAALLNKYVLGMSSPAIAQAQAVYCGTNITAINNAKTALDAFNQSGDSVPLTFPSQAASAQIAKSQAYIAFWNTTN